MSNISNDESRYFDPATAPTMGDLQAKADQVRSTIADARASVPYIEAADIRRWYLERFDGITMEVPDHRAFFGAEAYLRHHGITIDNWDDLDRVATVETIAVHVTKALHLVLTNQLLSK